MLQICAQSWKSATQDHFLASSDSSIEQAGESGYLTRPPSFPSFTAVRKKLFIHSSQYIAGDRPKPKRASVASTASGRAQVQARGRPTRPRMGGRTRTGLRRPQASPKPANFGRPSATARGAAAAPEGRARRSDVRVRFESFVCSPSVT